MDTEALLDKVRDSIKPTMVYSEPIERDGVIVVTASSVMGGGGGGEGEAGGAGALEGEGEATGSGGGFGVVARPAGAFVIRGQEVVWVPVVDPNRRLALAGIIAIVAICAWRSVLVRLFDRVSPDGAMRRFGARRG
jgi:uncharacterized spore protein YtfJ